MRMQLGKLLFVTAAMVAGSASASPYPPLEAAKKTVSKPVVVEQYGSDKLQFGELRLPAGKGPFPVVAVIDGGCWTRSFEDVTGTSPLADMLTKRGIATWNIEYRARGDAGAGYPGTFQDVGAGVDHLRALARRYPLDLKRLAIAGHSAGSAPRAVRGEPAQAWGRSRAKGAEAGRGRSGWTGLNS
jgi:acetyl esterase/lipase